jgi:putative addiction module CopG family antidote
LVEQLVTSGRYQNASEVLREGLRLVEQREAEDAYRLEALRAAVQLGAAAALPTTLLAISHSRIAGSENRRLPTSIMPSSVIRCGALLCSNSRTSASW